MLATGLETLSQHETYARWKRIYPPRDTLKSNLMFVLSAGETFRYLNPCTAPSTILAPYFSFFRSTRFIFWGCRYCRCRFNIWWSNIWKKVGRSSSRYGTHSPVNIKSLHSVTTSYPFGLRCASNSVPTSTFLDLPLFHLQHWSAASA